MSVWCLQFPPKNEQKRVNLRYHSSKVEFVCPFFGGIEDTIICFQEYLPFTIISFHTLFLDYLTFNRTLTWLFILYHKSTKNVWKLQKYKNFSADYLECKKKVESVLFLDPWIWLQFTDIRSSSKVLHLIWDSWLYPRFINSWFIMLYTQIQNPEY